MRARPPGAVTATTATQRVYEGIYGAVLERRLAPGEWLRESELAETFGVSRTVVRQALQRLAQEHVIEHLHNRGARVPQPGLDDAAHVFEARRVAECEIARQLGGRLSKADVATLQSLARAEQKAADAGDHGAAVRWSGEFHLELARRHGNPVLLRLLESLLPSTSMLMARYIADGRSPCVAHRHAELIAALQKSGSAAAAEMKQHLAELESSLTKAAPPPPRPLRDVFAAYRPRASASKVSRRSP